MKVLFDLSKTTVHGSLYGEVGDYKRTRKDVVVVVNDNAVLSLCRENNTHRPTFGSFRVTAYSPAIVVDQISLQLRKISSMLC